MSLERLGIYALEVSPYLKCIRRSGTKYTSRTRLSNADLTSCRPRLEQMEMSDNEETERREAELYG